MLRLILIGIVLVALSFAKKHSFHGEQVVKVEIENLNQLHLFKETVDNDVDVWSGDGRLVIGENHIRVNKSMKHALKNNGFKVTKWIEDVQALLDAESEQRSQHAEYKAANTPHLLAKQQNSFFQTWRSYDEILTYVNSLVSMYPQVTTLENVGSSIESRPIVALRIFGGGQSTDSTPKVFFQGGQHAREWIGPATVLYIATQLLSSTDNSVKQLLSQVEFIIVPSVNPDGYEYARSNYRLWRKNRRRVSSYHGVDLNRNWDVVWSRGGGSSSFPGSDVYRGTAPFSEPETAAISTYLKSLRSIFFAVDWHSYSQLLLRPYGYTFNDCPDEVLLRTVGESWVKRIQNFSGMEYLNQKSAQLYFTDGTAGDWFYSVGIAASFTVELRDTGDYGFILPASQIIPTGEENWQGILNATPQFLAAYLKNRGNN